MRSKILRRQSGTSEERLKGVEQCVEMLPDLQEFLLIGLDQSNNLIIQSTLSMPDIMRLCNMTRETIFESLALQEQDRMN